jgi:Tol biopolymer transport system component
MKRKIVIGIVVLLFFGCCLKDERFPSVQGDIVVNVIVLQESGGRVSWLPGKDVIAFDKTEKDGYTDVYVMSFEGSDSMCLTCDWLPNHNGNPEWHPSGEYIVFQAQDPNLQGLPSNAIGKFAASPGVGINNNIWVMTEDGSKKWQLTHVKDRHGALHPQFSPDGKKLLWSEVISPQMDEIGHWEIKLADFVIEKGVPSICNVLSFRPLDLQLYEVHGFSPDGKKILFSGVKQGGYYYDMEIYLMDIGSMEVTQLTNNDEWDEHAHFTPDGNYIIWVSSEDIPQKKVESWNDLLGSPPKLEYWIMDKDGLNKRRLSGFNVPGSSEYRNVPGGIGLGDFCVGEKGGIVIVAKMRLGYNGEQTVLIEFNLPV